MKIGHQIKFIVINQQANSLYSLIADGQYRSTSLGRDTWKSLIGSEASLQFGCNKEGFNAISTLEQSSRAIMNLTNVIPAILESGLVLKENPIITTRVEMWDITQVIMVRRTLEPWVIS